MMWLIYSHEHKAWWRANRCGYTQRMDEAGRYTEEQAADICWIANRYRSSVEQMPNEVMVPAPETEA